MAARNLLCHYTDLIWWTWRFCYPPCSPPTPGSSSLINRSMCVSGASLYCFGGLYVVEKDCPPVLALPRIGGFSSLRWFSFSCFFQGMRTIFVLMILSPLHCFFPDPVLLNAVPTVGRGNVIYFAVAGPTLKRRMTLGPFNWPKWDSNAWPSCWEARALPTQPWLLRSVACWSQRDLFWGPAVAAPTY